MGETSVRAAQAVRARSEGERGNILADKVVYLRVYRVIESVSQTNEGSRGKDKDQE